MKLFIFLVFSVGLCFFMWTHLKVMLSRKAQGAMPGFEKVQMDERSWKFSVIPNADPSKHWGTSIGAVIFGLIAGFLWMMWIGVIITGDDNLNFGLVTGTVSLVVAPTLFSAWLTVFLRSAERKKFQKKTMGRPYEFVVGDGVLTIDDRRYPASSIARLLIRNVVTGRESGGATIVGTSGTMIAAGLATAIQDEIRQARNAQMAAVGYSVFFESGGNRHAIGAALNEAQAFGLMKEVGDILDFKIG